MKALLTAMLMATLCTASAVLAQPAKQLFGAQRMAASAMTAQAIGEYARGCAAGSVALPETGPTWQAMRLSRNRNWGHPSTIQFIKDLSAYAAQTGWNGLYIGDISQPKGGPMLSGHSSHQIGMDVDIWLKPALDLGLSRATREQISSDLVVASNKVDVNRMWSPTHHLIIRRAAEDPRVARIFVNPAIKGRMCAEAPANDRAFLNKIRPWWGHNYHFHVRLNCPAGSPSCVNQAPPPPGDGCGEVAGWLRDIVNPPPPDPNAPKPVPKAQLTLQNLPPRCAQVLTSP